ncbi:MAG: SpoIIE family protein phosphatase [Salinivirgaceae bacterium]
MTDLEKYQQFPAALSQIIQDANNYTDSIGFIQNSFEALSTLPWDSFQYESSSCFVKNGNYFKSVSKNIDKGLQKKCKIDENGNCLCEKISQQKGMLFCDNNKVHYSVNKNDTIEKGHFCIPIKWKTELFGVLILQSNSKRNNFELEYFKTVVTILENIGLHKKAEEQLQIKAEQQNVLNQKLFSQSLEIDQKRLEVEEKNEEIRQKNEELSTLNENLHEQNELIEKANTEITSSINYASSIQKALLTPQNQVDKLFENFILYLPKNIVSGDFYVIKQIGKYKIIAVADCTGHGVPGGFITMLGINFIDTIFKLKNIETPAQVLELLRTKFKKVFESSNHHDGMDIALGIFNQETNMLLFSGAYNSLILVRDGGLVEYKGIKNPIGKHTKESDFINHEIQIQEGDLIYMFTDGFADQFGEKTDSKFYKHNFANLLVDIHRLPMEEQKSELLSVFNHWKSQTKQTDDVLVVGIKF